MDERLFGLLDDLCKTRGFRGAKEEGGERAIAEKMAELLRQFPWLTVTVEEVADGIFNVLAHDGEPDAIDLLIAGHLDTVPPSAAERWDQEQHSIVDGRYYALGAADTRSGIAACLDAIERVGPTRGVAYLFYGDEETNFIGMIEFVKNHPEVAPRLGLSLCGGYGIAHVGWRGCIEMEFLIEGYSAHASRPHQGANAGDAMAFVMGRVREVCMGAATERRTSANVAAIFSGTSEGLEKFKMSQKKPPPVKYAANKVPDVAWALLDVRNGGPEVTPAFIEGIARAALEEWNAAREGSPDASLREISLTFDMPAYKADASELQGLLDTFEPVHGGSESDPANTGFIDVSLVAAAHGTNFMCLSPAGGNAHSPDEHVVIASMEAYRDCCVSLLSDYKR